MESEDIVAVGGSVDVGQHCAITNDSVGKFCLGISCRSHISRV